MNEIEEPFDPIPKTIHLMAPSPAGLSFLEAALLNQIQQCEGHGRFVGLAGSGEAQAGVAEAVASMQSIIYSIREIRTANYQEMAAYQQQQASGAADHPNTVMRDDHSSS